MIIYIDEQHRIVAKLEGEMACPELADNVTSFYVERLPGLNAREELLFDPTEKAFYTRPLPAVDEEAYREKLAELAALKKLRDDAEQQKATALKWLCENDWKINKHTLGEWADDDERWLEYLADRAQARAAYDDACAVLTK